MTQTNQQAQGTKHSPSSEGRTQQMEQLVNRYTHYVRNKGMRRIESDEATEWFNGAIDVLHNPQTFGLNAEPVNTTNLPTVDQFIDACREAIQKAA